VALEGALADEVPEPLYAHGSEPSRAGGGERRAGAPRGRDAARLARRVRALEGLCRIAAAHLAAPAPGGGGGGGGGWGRAELDGGAAAGAVVQRAAGALARAARALGGDGCLASALDALRAGAGRWGGGGGGGRGGDGYESVPMLS